MQLYGEVYDEYAVQFPESLPIDDSQVKRTTQFEKAFLSRFLTPSTVMAEVGPGRCHLAFAVAPLVKKIYAVDVASGTANEAGRPTNFELKLTDGIRMPFDSDSIDLVCSNQLMEHLHPDDATEQLREIYRVLRPGGSYICVTPSRINGPHDCSAYFDDLPCPIEQGFYTATGLHLKEYNTSELLTVFNSVGFKRVQTWIGAQRILHRTASRGRDGYRDRPAADPAQLAQAVPPAGCHPGESDVRNEMTARDCW
jgi:ubiquinone/menaquinone biosynthesis C-methylase UbiE